MSGRHFVVYDDAGAILRTGSCPEGMYEQQASDGEHIMIGQCDDSTHYVAKENIVNKMPFRLTISGKVVVADGIDTITLSGIPKGSTLLVIGTNMTSYLVDDGEFEFSVDVPGPYTIKCAHPHYIAREWEIEGINP